MAAGSNVLPGAAQRCPETGPCRCRARSFTTARSNGALPAAVGGHFAIGNPTGTYGANGVMVGGNLDRFSNRLALVFAAILFGWRRPPLQSRGGCGAGALAGSAGQARAAVQLLETSLLRPPWKLAEADAASLHFLAAQMAVAAGQPERAVPHLGKVRQLARAFVSVPDLHARFLRQTAGLYQQIGLFGDSTALLETVVDKWRRRTRPRRRKPQTRSVQPGSSCVGRTGPSRPLIGKSSSSIPFLWNGSGT